MLLSIDRVLQLLVDGKSVEKIAELAKCSGEDVINVLADARKLLLKYEKPVAKRKIIIKKTKNNSTDEKTVDPASEKEREFLLKDVELLSTPVESNIIMVTAGVSEGNPGPSGIGIIIYDSDNKQIGKVANYIGERKENYSIYTSVLHALKIAKYFKPKSLKIRTNSQHIINQLNNKSNIIEDNIKKIYDEIIKLKDEIKNVQFEYITNNLNEKSQYLAKSKIVSS